MKCAYKQSTHGHACAQKESSKVRCEVAMTVSSYFVRFVEFVEVNKILNCGVRKGVFRQTGNYCLFFNLENNFSICYKQRQVVDLVSELVCGY